MDNKIVNSNQGKKKALIIAISDYDNLPPKKQLPFCRNDGEAIYEILQKQGYEIPDDWKLIGRVTSKQLRDALFEFFRNRTESKDTLLFYFSGHGIPDGYGWHYLAPSDIKTDLPDYHGIKFTDLEDQANKSPAKKIIRILDCCFSGAAGVKGSEEDVARSARADMDRTFKEGDGKCLLSSCLADQVSYKKKGESYSLFTYCVLEGLNGGKEGGAINLEGYVTPHTLGNYVYHRIMEEDRRQKPITKTEMSGDIILAYHPEFVKVHGKEGANFYTDDASTWYYRGLTLSSSGKLEESLKCYEKAIELKPNYAEAWYDKGAALSSLGRFEEAVRHFDKVLELKPNYAEAWYDKGAALSSLGRFEEALKCYEKAIEINPNYAEAWNGKGNVLSRLSKDKEALKCYEKAIELKPNYAEAWYDKGKVLLGKCRSAAGSGIFVRVPGLPKCKEALKCYEKAIEINPNYAEAWNGKGNVLRALNRYKEILKCYEKAIEINPNYAEAWYDLGLYFHSASKYDLGLNFHSSGKKYEEAIRCYDKFIDLNPNFSWVWHEKAYALDKLGKKDDAKKCHEKAKEMEEMERKLRKVKS